MRQIVGIMTGIVTNKVVYRSVVLAYSTNYVRILGDIYDHRWSSQ